MVVFFLKKKVVCRGGLGRSNSLPLSSHARARYLSLLSLSLLSLSLLSLSLLSLSPLSFSLSPSLPPLSLSLWEH